MTNIDETELARLEALTGRATPVPWAEMNHGAFPMVYGPSGERVCRAVDKAEDSVYIAAACNAVPALVAEVRRLREKVEALEWWDEVRQYTLFNHHPLWWADGHRTPEGNRYANAEKEYDEIRKAAFDDVYRGRPC